MNFVSVRYLAVSRLGFLVDIILATQVHAGIVKRFLSLIVMSVVLVRFFRAFSCEHRRRSALARRHWARILPKVFTLVHLKNHWSMFIALQSQAGSHERTT